MELSNRNHGFQHNPAADPNKGTSLFTQLLYFLNVYPTELSNGNYATTQDAAQKSYDLLAELIKLGREDFEKQVKDGPSLKRFLLKKFDGPGAERALALLQEGISINHPLLANRSILSIASGMEKATVKVKFPGGKLVLQTAEGSDFENEDLQYKMEDVNGKRILVAEVIVPKEMLTKDQLEALAKGDSIYLLPDMLGFRIPSTELHSAIPMRIKRVYANNTLSNVIIAPKELVPIHGSDFDVDALFVITKELFNSSDSTVLSGLFVKEYIDAVKGIFESLSKLEQSSTPDFAKKVRYLRENVKKLSGLMSQIESEESPLIDEDVQNEYENEFNNFVNTPQLRAGSATSKIIRTQMKNYNEERARAEWGAKKGLRYTTLLGIPQWVQDNSLYGNAEKLRKEIDSFITEHKNLEPTVMSLLGNMVSIADAMDWRNSKLLGHADTPVGYKLEDEKYVFDPEFLGTINKELEVLTAIDSTLQKELVPVIGKEIKGSIKRLQGLKAKFLRNAIIDTMLTVVSDERNKLRMTAPISFDPLTLAIEKISKSLIPSTKYDLGDIGDEYKAYSSLTAGMVLTGAFANASKSFGYFARAGATPEVQKVYDYYGALATMDKALSNINELTDIEGLPGLLSDVAQEIMNSPLLEITDKMRETYKQVIESPSIITKQEWNKFVTAMKNVVSKAVTSVNVSKFAKINTSPLLNKRYKFNLSIDGSNYSFDRLAIADVRNEYSVTQVYDALTNEAIDNLKLGDLVKARINTNTGSAVIGLVAVGVPMDVIVKLLYQPIFADLSSGKVNNISKWLENLERVYQKDMLLASGTLSDTELDEMLKNSYHHLQNKSVEEISKNLDPDGWNTQLKALDLFLKGFKIGEDMRNASTFINLIRTHDVFIEDILQLDDNLVNQIGTPVYQENGDLILETRKDYSFVIPNLFESAPHIKEAYLAHESVKNIIFNNLKIHSPEVQEFAEDVYDLMPSLKTRNEQGEIDSKQEKLANIRKSLSYYILSGIAASRVDVKPSVIEVGKKDEKGKKNKVILSKLRTFSNEVATMIESLKKEVKDNAFLKNLVPVRDWKGASYLSFKSGVNLASEDIQEIALGFKALNHYTRNEDGTISKITNPGLAVSNIQIDLLNYAILNYGLQFSTSNYSNYIAPKMFKTTDEIYNLRLDALIAERSDMSKQHFALSHIMQNASSLPFVPYENLKPTIPGSKTSKAVYPGKASVHINVGLEDKTIDVYYDLAVSLTTDKSEKKFNATEYIRRGYGKKIVVFRKIAETGDTAYYQKVGKTSDAFHTPHFGTYDITSHFDRSRPNIEYHYESGNDVFTYSGLARVINPGDRIFIYPSYNFDRTEGREVEVVSKTLVQSSSVAPGYKIKVKEPKPIEYIVWHGSDENIESFRSANPEGYFSKVKGGSDKAIFFSKDKAPKGTVYGDRLFQKQFVLNFNNPLVVDTKEGYSREKESFKDLVDRALANNNDGVIVKNVHDNFTTDIYIALNTEQIRAVTIKDIDKMLEDGQVKQKCEE